MGADLEKGFPQGGGRSNDERSGEERKSSPVIYGARELPALVSKYPKLRWY